MNISTQPWRIVLIPRPLSPAAAFAYFLLSRASIGGKSFLGMHYVRWVFYPKAQTIDLDKIFSESCIFINLNTEPHVLERLIMKLVAVSDRTSRWPATDLVRMKNFFFFSGRKSQYAWQKWLEYTGKLSYQIEPKDALQSFCTAIEGFLDRKCLADAIGDTLDMDVSSPYRHPDITDIDPVTMPLTKKQNHAPDERSRREIYDYTVTPLSEGNVFELMSDQAVLVIVGSPGLGKSTLAPALFNEVKNSLIRVHSRSGIWKTLNVSAHYTTLDGATPVGDAVLRSQAQDREAMNARKRLWDTALITEMVTRMHAEQSNLVITDMPGLSTDVTRLLAVRATHAIILASHDAWEEEIVLWEKYLEEIAVPSVARLKCTDQQSMMSSHFPEKGFSGRLYNPNRLITGCDPCINVMGRLVPFDTIPGWLGRLHHRIEEQARGNEWGYHQKATSF